MSNVWSSNGSVKEDDTVTSWMATVFEKCAGDPKMECVAKALGGMSESKAKEVMRKFNCMTEGQHQQDDVSPAEQTPLPVGHFFAQIAHNPDMHKLLSELHLERIEEDGEIGVEQMMQAFALLAQKNISLEDRVEEDKKKIKEDEKKIKEDETVIQRLKKELKKAIWGGAAFITVLIMGVTALVVTVVVLSQQLTSKNGALTDKDSGRTLATTNNEHSATICAHHTRKLHEDKFAANLELEYEGVAGSTVDTGRELQPHPSFSNLFERAMVRTLSAHQTAGSWHEVCLDKAKFDHWEDNHAFNSGMVDLAPNGLYYTWTFGQRPLVSARSVYENIVVAQLANAATKTKYTCYCGAHTKNKCPGERCHCVPVEAIEPEQRNFVGSAPNTTSSTNEQTRDGPSMSRALQTGVSADVSEGNLGPIKNVEIQEMLRAMKELERNENDPSNGGVETRGRHLRAFTAQMSPRLRGLLVEHPLAARSLEVVRRASSILLGWMNNLCKSWLSAISENGGPTAKAAGPTAKAPGRDERPTAKPGKSTDSYLLGCVLNVHAEWVRADCAECACNV